MAGTGDQQDRQGARMFGLAVPGHAPRPRRRGDRMNNTRAVQWRDLRYRSGGTCDWTQVENRAALR